MNVGIFGGTFNPVHNGHINLAGCYKEALKLDKIIFIPTSTPPHKLAKNLATNAQRIDMLHMALEGLHGMELSTMELERQGNSYTYDTLVEYKKHRPDDNLFLIVGSDMFLSFHQWYRYEDMLKMVVLCTAARESADSLYKMHQYAKHVLHLEQNQYFVSKFPVVLASSSLVRRNLRRGFSITTLVPSSVERYLLEHGLYFENKVESYKALLHYRLSERRYIHSLCVADCARQLAQQYGDNPRKAYIVGLLHDVMRDESAEKQLNFLQKAGIMVSPLEQNAPALYHAMAGAVYCKEVLGIEDELLLDAIRYHTTARGQMTRLDKLLFVADLVSEDRSYPDVEVTRALAWQSLDAALLYGLAFTVKHLKEKGVPVHSDTIDAYNHFRNEDSI